MILTEDELGSVQRLLNIHAHERRIWVDEAEHQLRTLHLNNEPG